MLRKNVKYQYFLAVKMISAVGMVYEMNKH